MLKPVNQHTNLMNSVYNRSLNAATRPTSLQNPGINGTGNRQGAVSNTASFASSSSGMDDPRTTIRKQMQDQIRNLFEKEKSSTNPFVNDYTTNVNGTEKEDDDKEDKLLNSGKIYNFKEVSNKIMRAKTSVSAGQAVVAAKRKISELKRKLASGNEDSDELQMALTHAKKMEVVAERKKNNLQLEEMVTNTMKRDELMKKMENSSSSMTVEAYEKLKDEINDKQLKHIDETEELRRREAEQTQEEIEQRTEELTEQAVEQMNEFTEEMSDEESEMLREMSELVDAMEVVDPHMNEEDLSKLKLKHRLSEQKSLMKADMEYLRSVFKDINSKGLTMPKGMGTMSSGITSGMSSAFPSAMMSSMGSADSGSGSMSAASPTSVTIDISG
ncbi:MAG: hypothetical protein K6E53_11540 [Lachnospiraceae bacterium]|nr:hypothetical protein [Lachnospiraceae bacterium]